MSEAAQTNSADARVRQAVSMVQDGIVTLDEIQATEDSPLTDADLRAQVEEQLAEREHGDDDSTEESTGQATSADEIDWRALYEEFGFNTPNANGKAIAHPIQIRGALETSEQNVTGDMQGHVDDAVRAGYLHEIRRTADDGGQVTHGYRLGDPP